MDTRTQLLIPNRDNKVVGWNKASNDGDYLAWGGDNQQSGEESILVDMAKLTTDFNTPIDISFAAFWYDESKAGKVSIEFTIYKGGNMQQDGFSWINKGGHIVESLSLDCVVNLHTDHTDSQGQKLALLNYDKLSKTGKLTKQ